ncbi:nuclear transport factor 2 family protein [Phormidesmis sp. 146-12]
MKPLEKTPAQLFADHLALIGTDIHAWAELLAEDAVMEFPCASAPSSVERLEGRLEICNSMKTAIAQMQNLTLTSIGQYQTSNPNVLFAEVHVEGIIAATGHYYQQNYVVRLEAKAGKLFRYREYWNPSAVLGTWSNTRQALHAE